MKTEAVIAKLIRMGAEIGAQTLEGKPPTPGQVAKQIVGVGIELVGAEALAGYLRVESARKVDDDVDAFVESKLKGK